MIELANAEVAVGYTGLILRGKYRIRRRIGTGGTGTVYEADHLHLDRKVAIKMLHPELSHDRSVVERFHREALAASHVGHPNIVQVYDLDRTDDGTEFMALEYLDGESLGDAIKSRRRIPFASAIAIFHAVTSALAAVHRIGVIHRDVKSDNIFLCRRANSASVPKLLDFGIAKTNALFANDADGITKTGSVLGTPVFMSPEQIRGDVAIDARTDIYSLGVVFYETLAGALPIDGPTLFEVISKIAYETPVSVDVHRPDTPRALVQLVDRMLAKDPSARPQTCEEIAATLAAISSALDRDDSDDQTIVFGSDASSELAAMSPDYGPTESGIKLKPVVINGMTLRQAAALAAASVSESGTVRAWGAPASVPASASASASESVRASVAPPAIVVPRLLAQVRRRRSARFHGVALIGAAMSAASLAYWFVMQL